MLPKLTTIIYILCICGCATSTYPTSVDKTEYDTARAINSVIAYDKFLENYPESAWRDSAIYYRDKSALEKAKLSDTPEAYQAFIDKYPNSDWLEQAKYFKIYGASESE